MRSRTHTTGEQPAAVCVCRQKVLEEQKLGQSPSELGWREEGGALSSRHKSPWEFKDLSLLAVLEQEKGARHLGHALHVHPPSVLWRTGPHLASPWPPSPPRSQTRNTHILGGSGFPLHALCSLHLLPDNLLRRTDTERSQSHHTALRLAWGLVGMQHLE